MLNNSKINEINNLLSNLLHMKKNGAELTAVDIYNILTNNENYFYQTNLTDFNNSFEKNYLTDMYRNIKDNRISLKSFGAMLKNLYGKEKKSDTPKFKIPFIKEKKRTIYVLDDLKMKYTVCSRGRVETEDSIKLYINLKSEYLKDSLKIMFDFLNKNSIDFQAKLSDADKLDNLVIRVNNVENAKIISDFVNKNVPKEFIKNPNPFTMNDGNVGLAKDRDKSYNNEISILLMQFVYNYDLNKHNLSAYNKDNLLDDFRLFISKNSYNSTNEINRILFSLLSGNNGYEYFINAINSNTYEGIESLDTLAEVPNILKQAYYSNFSKHSVNNIYSPICEYVYNNKLEYFTSANGARANVSKLDRNMIIKYFGETDLKNKLLQFEANLKKEFICELQLSNEANQNNFVQNNNLSNVK